MAALTKDIDTSTDSGQKLFAQLVGLSGAFADLVPATATLADNAAEAAERMAEAGRRALESLGQSRQQLEIELLRAQGNEAGALARDRANTLARSTAGLNATDTAAVTAALAYNNALQDQIAALRTAEQATKQAQEAAERLAQQAIENAQRRAEAILSERTSLEDRLLQQQGDTAALRARELAGLDASNRAILERIFALQDAQAAEQAAAQAAQEAAAEAQRRAESIAGERSSLEDRLLQLQGDTTALRARELAGIDASNRALLERIFALQDAQTAEQAAAEATRQAADAAAQAAQDAQRRADAILSERTGLQDQLDQLLLSNTELMAKQRAALDESNRALFDQVQAATAAKAAAEQLAQAQEAAAQAEAQRLSGIANERTGLEDRLLQLQGDTTALRTRELAGLDASNRALLERIFALQDAQTAEQAAAEATRQAAEAAQARAEAILGERTGLEDRLLQLQGDTAALRARELLGVDASNRALLERIFALQDAQAAEQVAAEATRQAADAAAQALDALNGKLSDLASTRFDLENELLGLNG
ncbi:MAG: hypothetical protein ACOVN9_11060, partial [Inhella sp.]